MRRLAGAVTVICATAFLAIVALEMLMVRASGPYDISLAILALSLLGSAAIGFVIIHRTGNSIGWIFLAFGTSAVLWAATGEYLVYSAGIDKLPAPTFVAVAGNELGNAMVFALALICLLFPTGHLPSTRWRWVLWLWWIGFALSTVWNATRPGVIWGAEGRVTTTITSSFAAPQWLADALIAVAAVCGVMAGLAGIVSLVLRARRATGEERLQIRWLSWLAATVATLIVSIFLLGLATLPWRPTWIEPVTNVMFACVALLIVIGMPAAVAIAILRYKLFEIDAVIRKTIVFGLLAGFIGLVYGAIVGGVGAIAGTINGWLSFLAAATLALLFQPARDRARKVADRMVYGDRATPYEVLAEFSGRVGDAYETDDVLPRMARILAEGTGATSATVWLRVRGELHAAATFPRDAEPQREYPVEVRHQGELLGELSITTTAADPLNPAKEKLVADLAAQAGLVLRNVRLIEELKASRQRLVAAQDEERRKLERNLHDGAQQQLVALAVKQRLLGNLIGRDDDGARAMVATLAEDTNDALENLRDLARGIYPPLLADKGLVAALEAQARRAPVPTTVEGDGIGRFGQDVEAAVYFSCLEALQNVAKYAQALRAEISLTNGDGRMTFQVVDDGVGFDVSERRYGTGLQGIADRLAALGGELEVRSDPGHGTRIAGHLPVALADTGEGAR